MKTQIEKLDRLIREIEMDEYLNEETLPKIRKAKGLLNTLHEQCNIVNVVGQSELLPKRLSNQAYKNAKTMRYEDFVKWWDEQV